MKKLGISASTNGKLLNREGVDSLQQQFFSSSTATHRYQIPVPVLGIGGSGDDQVEALRPETRSDWSLIKNVTGNSLFYRSPRLFYLGITNHFGEYGCLRKQAILDEVLPKLRYRTIGHAEEMYRIRSNLTKEQQFDEGQFDSPPFRRRGFGRFDHGKLPVLYASPSLTVCIHECRVTLADDIFVATLRPKRVLNFIDLSGNYDEPDNADPFDSVEWFLNASCRRHGQMSIAIVGGSQTPFGRQRHATASFTTAISEMLPAQIHIPASTTPFLEGPLRTEWCG